MADIFRQDDTLLCPKCAMRFCDSKILQNHLERIHKTRVKVARFDVPTLPPSPPCPRASHPTGSQLVAASSPTGTSRQPRASTSALFGLNSPQSANCSPALFSECSPPPVYRSCSSANNSLLPAQGPENLDRRVLLWLPEHLRFDCRLSNTHPFKAQCISKARRVTQPQSLALLRVRVCVYRSGGSPQDLLQLDL
ncbi:hypothetical protein K438DRAFT_1971891 [Mycena galopus ATCC 62051]|nr:hypothetical protein K438DRAFT_1971891 [Mycena galopus ATCC 62051]